MLRYLTKRLLIFIPTLIAISLLAFGLSKLTPGDPITDRLQAPDDSGGASSAERYEKEVKELARQLGLDKPSFYFALSSAAFPDTTYRVLLPSRRDAVSRLTDRCGNWSASMRYYQSVENFEQRLNALPDSVDADVRIKLRKKLSRLYFSSKERELRAVLQQVQDTAALDPVLLQQMERPLTRLSSSLKKMYSEATPAKRLIPRLYWYGLDNQYHNWLTNFLVGNFGEAMDGRPVVDKISNAIWWTLIINIVTIILAFAIAIPLGITSAVRRDSVFDRSTSLTLFILYSLPTFWIATMLVVFFTTPEYGLKIFKSIGLGDLPSSAPFMARFWETAGHLVLPVICNTYVSLAFIARQMRGGMIEVLQQDYIRTAKAKGLEARKVVWKHSLRNSLFPIITLFASIFPAAVGGSVVIELIFNIPGMGRLMLDSIFAADWPVIFTILMLVALLTVIGNFVADLLYGWADPRVRFA
ncbi:MAG: ABC transporter permease [Bacteroidota bacterium]